MCRSLGLFLAAVVLISTVSEANAAIVLTVGGSNYVGYFNPDTPANLSDEASYINTLIDQAAPSAVTIDSRYYVRSSSLIGLSSDALDTGAVTNTTGGDNTLDLGTGVFNYVLGKYGKAGAVWYDAAGFTGEVELPLNFTYTEVDKDGFPKTTAKISEISHSSAFIDDGIRNIPLVPEPASLAIWALGIAGAGLVAQRRRKLLGTV